MKRIIFYLTGIFIVLFTISSCTITQEYHFNRDLSGTATTTIDMTALMEFMASMDSTGEAGNSLDTLDESFAETAEELRDLGAENVEYGWQGEGKNIIFLSYDFKDIETLNKIVSSQDATTGMAGSTTDEGPKAEFDNKGKRTLIYKAADLKDSELANSEDMESMSEYYTFKTIFTFDRKIKNLEAEGYEISEDNKKISMEATLKDVLEEDFSQDFVVKLSMF